MSQAPRHTIFLPAFSACLAAFFLLGCSDAAEKKAQTLDQEAIDQITIGVEGFVLPEGAKQETSIDGPVVLLDEGEHVLFFDLDVPQAGRYAVYLNAAAFASGRQAWVEDYVNNPDERTYDITGKINLKERVLIQVVEHRKVGSPLNAGKHPMALHIQGPCAVHSLAFEKVLPHRPSEEILVQSWEGDQEVLVWADEFEQDGQPDSTKWTHDLGDWGWGNNELQFYTQRELKNARVENGSLLIEAHRDSTTTGGWTSARLTTRGKVAFVYGRIEIRAKVPSGKGNWAAGWTLGNDYVDELSWPYCGEIDILESVGYQMNDSTGDGTAHASVHSGAYYFKLGNQPTATMPVAAMDRKLHTYSVEWAPDAITAQVDGQTYLTYADTSSELSWPFNRPQNIILNLTMGGGWGGLEGMDSTLTRQMMEIDYVRVYERRP